MALYARLQRRSTIWTLVNVSDGLANETDANVTLMNVSRLVLENVTAWAAGQPLFALDVESRYFRMRVQCQCFPGICFFFFSLMHFIYGI